jgi:pimeloyl-ACP methyl ester carboxylesterase
VGAHRLPGARGARRARPALARRRARDSERGRRVEVVDLPDAGHDLHLEAPEPWRAAVTRFLDGLDAP